MQQGYTGSKNGLALGACLTAQAPREQRMEADALLDLEGLYISRLPCLPLSRLSHPCPLDLELDALVGGGHERRHACQEHVRDHPDAPAVASLFLEWSAKRRGGGGGEAVPTQAGGAARVSSARSRLLTIFLRSMAAQQKRILLCTIMNNHVSKTSIQQ